MKKNEAPFYSVANDSRILQIYSSEKNAYLVRVLSRVTLALAADAVAAVVAEGRGRVVYSQGHQTFFSPSLPK